MADNDPRTKRQKGNGPGWGGPAKGASTSRIKPGDPDGITKLRHDPDNLAVKAERRRKAMQLYEDVIDDREAPPMARIVAADKLLDRIDGKPIARTVTANVGDPSKLSDADLAAIIAGGGAPAAEAPDDPPEPGGVVH